MIPTSGTYYIAIQGIQGFSKQVSNKTAFYQL